MALAGSKGSNCRFRSGRSPDVLGTLYVDGLVDVLVDLPHGIQEVALQDFLESCEFRRRNFAVLLEFFKKFDGTLDVWNETVVGVCESEDGLGELPRESVRGSTIWAILLKISV